MVVLECVINQASVEILFCQIDTVVFELIGAHYSMAHYVDIHSTKKIANLQVYIISGRRIMVEKMS